MANAPERAAVFEGARIGPESIAGVAVPATKQLIGTTIDLGIKSENKTSKARGSRFTTLNQQNKEWSEADITQDVFTIPDWAYIQSMAFGGPDITVPGGGTLSRDLAWDIPAFTAISPKPFTIEDGSAAVRAKKATYFHVPDLGVEFKRDGVSASGRGVGQKVTDGITMTPGTNEVQTMSKASTVTGGTFAITFKGEKTAPIAFNASNATVLAALLLLPNLGTGDIVLGGGPVNTTPVTITFGGRYESTNVPLMVVDSALLTGGGTYGIVETTPGVQMSQLARVALSGAQWDLFVDTTWAGLGNTKIPKTLGASWSIKELHKQAWFANTAIAGWTDTYDKEPTTEIKFSAVADSTAMAFLTNLRAGDIIFPRIKGVGALIEGSLFNTAQFDFAMTLTDIDDNKDEDGLISVEYTGEVDVDPTTGKSMASLLRCQLTAIS